MDREIQNFENLIKPDKYQVFLLSCPAYFPFVFARHPWFVFNKKGIITRYEIRHYKNISTKNYLHINTQPPFEGIQISFLISKKFKKIKLLSFLEGDDDTVVSKIIEFLENSEKTYPFCNKYSYFGPNSNTYVQNVLDKFTEFGIKLAWRHIGKGYKIKTLK